MRVRRWVLAGLVLGTVGGFVLELMRSHPPAAPPVERTASDGRDPVATGG